MTTCNYVFQYTEVPDFGQPTEFSMDTPIRNIDEMCEYFQRFLMGTGMVFEEGERIGVIKPQSKKLHEVMDFGDYNSSFLDGPLYGGSHVRGGYSNDIINLS